MNRPLRLMTCLIAATLRISLRQYDYAIRNIAMTRNRLSLSQNEWRVSNDRRKKYENKI